MEISIRCLVGISLREYRFTVLLELAFGNIDSLFCGN